MALLQDPANTPVFIHCRRGADRVGVVVACYRMVHDGWSNRLALDEAKRNHINILEVLMQRYIRNFDAGRMRQAMAQVPQAGAAGGSR
jgi:protein tyrosine/serine phosphatase